MKHNYKSLSATEFGIGLNEALWRASIGLINVKEEISNPRFFCQLSEGSGIKSLIKHLTIKAGQYLNYLSHHIRDEIWTIVDGTGEMVIDGLLRNVRRGDVVYIARGQRHAIKAFASGDLHCIEVQIGSELVENDIEKFEWQR